MTNTYTTMRGNVISTNETGTHCYMWPEGRKGERVRIKKAEYEQIIREDELERKLVAEQEAAEDAFENAATEEQIDAAWAEVQQMIARGEVVEYKGNYIPVRGGAWEDPMNSCFYTVIDHVDGHDICTENSNGGVFALRNPYGKDFDLEAAVEATEESITTEEIKEIAKELAPKKKRIRKSKDIAYDGNGITLTAKQVDFIKHLPDTYFWENGLDSCIWVDCLCDDIGGQFKGKPMTVGAMISTLCEKGLGSRCRENRDGRKCTSFELTELGKKVAAGLGL